MILRDWHKATKIHLLHILLRKFFECPTVFQCRLGKFDQSSSPWIRIFVHQWNPWSSCLIKFGSDLRISLLLLDVSHECSTLLFQRYSGWRHEQYFCRWRRQFTYWWFVLPWGKGRSFRMVFWVFQKQFGIDLGVRCPFGCGCSGLVFDCFWGRCGLHRVRFH